MQESNRDQWQATPKGQPLSSAKDRFVAEVKTFAQDVEELIKATADQTGEKIAAARARAEESLRKTRAGVAEAGRDMAQRTRAAAGATNQYVHENPWPVVGAAVAIAFVVGYLSRRR
jgi:ElaB/YqjD/DUF883 family membrane-anchored ribosome-binding protein